MRARDTFAAARWRRHVRIKIQIACGVPVVQSCSDGGGRGISAFLRILYDISTAATATDAKSHTQIAFTLKILPMQTKLRVCCICVMYAAAINSLEINLSN